MTRRESVLDALLAQTDSLPGVDVRRGGELPTRVPEAGLVIIRDGDPGDPEVTLSPPRYHYQHRAEMEVYVQPLGDIEPEALPNALDALLEQIGAILSGDPTLAGACDWCEPEAPQTNDLVSLGSADIAAAVVPVILYYTTTGPLA